MSADHRRPLFALLVVAFVCALLIGQGIRTDGVVDFIVGRSATPGAAAVAEPVTLEPRPDRPRAPAAAPGGDVEPTGSGSTDGKESGGQSGRGASSPQPPDHAEAGGKPPHAEGGGKPPHANDGQSQGREGQSHGSHARAEGDSPGKGEGGQGKGRGKNHAGHPGQGHGPTHDNVPDHVPEPAPLTDR